MIACASALEADEEEMLAYEGTKLKHPCALSRLAVSSAYQNKGIAKYLIAHIEKEIARNGYDGICLLVSKDNDHAKAVYDHMHYQCFSQCRMYDQDWYCYEKELGEWKDHENA